MDNIYLIGMMGSGKSTIAKELSKKLNMNLVDIDNDIEIINVGPGESSEGHAPNESISIDELVDAAVIHLEVIDSLLGLNSQPR